MRRPQATLRHADAETAHAFRDPLGQHREALRNGCCAPFGDHFHADRGHLQRDKMIALAHVEAAGIADVAGIREINRVLGAHIAAAGRRLFQRRAALMAFGNVEKGPAVGAEQPFVGREDHEVRIELPDVERQHARALRRVDQKQRAVAAQRRRYLFKVDQPAVGPVHRRDRGQRHRGRARPFDAGEDRRGPVAIAGLTDRLDGKALCAGAGLPFQHRRGMIVFQHDDAAAARNRQKFGRRRHAVTDRGDQRDVGGIGVDQPGGGDACAVVLAAGKTGVERPGLTLAAHGGAGGLLGFQRQRTVGGRIQIADIAWDIEQAALRRKHLHHQFIVAATRSINIGSSKLSAVASAPASIMSA